MDRERDTRLTATTMQWSKTPSPPSSTKVAPASPTNYLRWVSTSSSAAFNETSSTDPIAPGRLTRLRRAMACKGLLKATNTVNTRTLSRIERNGPFRG